MCNVIIKRCFEYEYKVAERFISSKKNREIFGEIKSANADMSNV
jgi:hypothetical protein